MNLYKMIRISTWLYLKKRVYRNNKNKYNTMTKIIFVDLSDILFEVDSISGEVTVSERLDYEKTQQHRFTVRSYFCQ